MSALRFLRAATAAGFVLAIGSVIATSCATPDFDFGDGPSSLGGNTGLDSCENRTKDPGEGDVDCGGQYCDKCALGRTCNADIDCENDSCTAGKCQAVTCTDRVKNGKETDVDCGGPGTECAPCGTGRICEKDSNCSSGVCTNGECQAPTCKDKTQNQNEVDVDCGGECAPCDVGLKCEEDEDCRAPAEDVPHQGSPFCNDNEVCELACEGDGVQRDCNEKASDGCETNVHTSLAHCGACDAACAPAHGKGECSGGKCGIASCDDGYADVNGKASDGCEVHYLTDPKHCGVSPDALVACSTVNGTASCEDGVCGIACASGFDDCNGNVADGCETNLRTSTNHCTECGKKCSPQGNKAAVCDPDNNVDVCGLTACPVPMGTDTSCTTCGVACGAATPYCHDETVGCKAYKPIDLAKRQTFTFKQQTSFSGTTAAVFNVTGTPAGNRLLVVGVTRRANTLSTPTVTYGSTNLTKLAEQTAAGQGSYIFVLPECELAAAGNKALTVSVASGDTFGAVVADAVLFSNVAQPLESALTRSQTSSPAKFQTTTVSEDGWFYGIAIQQSTTWQASSPSASDERDFKSSTNDPQQDTIASVWGPLAGGGVDFGWTLSGSTTWIAAGLPLVPATAAVTCP